MVLHRSTQGGGSGGMKPSGGGIRHMPLIEVLLLCNAIDTVCRISGVPKPGSHTPDAQGFLHIEP